MSTTATLAPSSHPVHTFAAAAPTSPASSATAPAAVPSFMRWARYANGIVVSEPGMSVRDAVVKSGLDYTVTLIDMFGRDNLNNDRVVGFDGHFGTVRRDKDGSVTPLAVVKSRYSVANNIDAFDFAQSLVDDWGANVVAAAAFGDPLGAQAYLALRASDAITVGGDDAHDVYVLLMNSHDGSSGITVSVIAVRRDNGTEVGFELPGAPQRWSIRHSGDIYAKYREAEKTATMVNKWTTKYEGMTRLLLGARVTETQIDKFVQRFLPTPSAAGDKSAKTWAERRMVLRTMCKDAHDGDGFGAGTHMAVFNATCSYIDHRSATRGGEPELIRARRAIEGRNTLTKAKAWRLLTESAES